MLRFKHSFPVLLLVLAGCASTSSTLLGTGEGYPPRPDDHPIEIFISRQDVSRPYVKVAILTSTGSGAYASWDAIMESMKEKARAVGADALVIGPKLQVAEYSTMPTGKLQEALAIRYTD